MDLRGVLVIEDRWRDAAGEWSVPAAEHVATRPIACHALAALTGAGVREVLVASSTRSASVAVDCLSEAARRAGVTLRFLDQADHVDVGAALRIACDHVQDAPCLVHSARGLSAQPLAPLAEDLRAGPDVIVTVHHAAPPGERLDRATESALRLANLDPRRSALGMAGIWGFGPGALRTAVAGTRRGTAAAAEPVDVGALASMIEAGGGQLRVRVIDLWRAYGGDPDELLELNRLVLDHVEGDAPTGEDDGNRIEGRVCIHETAVVRDSVIAGPVIIAEGALVKDAYIGPYTAVGRDAQIAGAEIERSIVADGASISHIAPRITNSVIGRGAQVFRDFSLPKALRLQVGENATIGLC